MSKCKIAADDARRRKRSAWPSPAAQALRARRLRRNARRGSVTRGGGAATEVRHCIDVRALIGGA